MNPNELLVFEPTAEAGRATLTVDAAVRSPHPVNPLLFGKFCEHLGANINKGMEAQVLFNPTFYHMKVDERFFEHMLRGARLPEGLDPHADHKAGAAPGWMRIGGEAVRLSPDVGPGGNMVQRVETAGATAHSPAGIGQWTHLPLHRTREYEFRVVARAAEPCRLRLGLGEAETTLELSHEFETLAGSLVLPDAPEDEPALLQLVADAPANVVVDRVLIYPADHVNHADPDVIRMLKEARLPILRWPGGNFVSGYNWRDGIGPVDLRPTRPNPAWGGNIEPNLFGTDEFIDFCRAVGCEPMICINAGNGQPADAAAWLQYCNGAADTPMGRLRAEHGHAEPFAIHYWEIGNEVFGAWQIGHTTPAGYVDRYRRFREALLAVDPTIRLIACGGLHYGLEHDWNVRLLAGAGATADCHSHHILEGGAVPADIDVAELYHAFTGYPAKLRSDYLSMRRAMRAAGIERPRLAITELQEFAHLPHVVNEPVKRESPQIPNPSTIAEALFFTGIAHECIRLGELVEMITHSATVNHGGGLRKRRERVFANPVHYAHQMGIALAGGTPLGVRLRCGTFSTREAIHGLPKVDDASNLDAAAVLTADGKSVILSLVHRSAAAGPIELTVDVAGVAASGEAEVVTLAGESPVDANSLGNPEKIAPAASTAAVADGRVRLLLAPFSLTHVRVAVRSL